LVTLKTIDISIVITSYNYGHFIKECIDSCLLQASSGLNYEVIVIDDGSTDQTPSVLTTINDVRLRKFRIENSGIEKAANLAFENAYGKYVVRVDADDKLYPNFLRSISPYLEMGCGFIYSNYAVINAASEILDEIQLPSFQVSEIYQRGDFLATGTVYLKNNIMQLGGYNTEKINNGLENYQLILMLLNLGHIGIHVPLQLFGYRRHGSNLSETKKKQIISNGKALFTRMGLGIYRTNEFHPYNLVID
jgi:glycosyltransferase involved in cell wall biosynthesis